MVASSVLPRLQPWQYRLHGQVEGELQIETGPDLPRLTLQDRRGTTLGAILGFVIDLRDGSLPQGRFITEHVLDPRDPDAFVIALREDLGGRFLLVLEAGDLGLAYPDAGAQVSCVYDHETGLTGATADALLPEVDYQRRFNAPLFDALGIDGEGWFPAGITAHHGLSRLLPNHRLDLRTGTSQRFWPRSPILETSDPEAAAREFARLMKLQLRALAGGKQRVALALTAGRETRVLLACAKDFLDQVDVLTIVGSDRHAKDTLVARRIARSFGLRHREVARRTATPEERQRFIRRGGHATADSNSHFHPSVWEIAQSHVFAGGLWGEIGRAFFWRKEDTPNMKVTPKLLLRRFGLPDRSPEVTEALAKWLRGLEGWPAKDILDLAYIEHRLGPWGSAQFCCDPTLVRHAPMLTQSTARLMLSLPAAWKESSRLGTRVVALEWPELASIPYNSLGRVQDFRMKLQRFLQNPGLLAKKLRKMRG